MINDNRSSENASGPKMSNFETEYGKNKVKQHTQRDRVNHRPEFYTTCMSFSTRKSGAKFKKFLFN